MELFAGKPLLGPDGNEIDAEKALEGKRFYKEVKDSGKNLEIVLVSRDREDEDLKEYLTEHCGGWVAIPFGDDRIQEFLAKYEVPTIPALKVLNSDGSIAIDDARNQVQEKGRDDPVKLFDEWLEKLNG
ncbi:hypothetical protein TELCIR_11481 [Teladorsagia circumcincta]|uniref:protein-disulfide reductase n=1 Tax=Teladorsagia circumcincta TaxID=45464 RepID=A0A2G9UAL8_TELCI|nr:hypothetical protein TELCIR_11481 [Teladorsagia circumcincta]